MVVEKDEETGRVTLHIRGATLMLSRGEALKLIRFLFIALYSGRARSLPLGYDNKGQGILL